MSRRPRILELMRGASLEVSARDPLAGEGLAGLVAAGSAVFINITPGDTHHGMVAAATRLRRAGFRPVPHVAARPLASFTQLNDYLARLAGEAGVDSALVIGGDLDRPVGPFASSFEILSTGLFERHGIRRVGLAGYPEGHPRIGSRALADALRLKLGLARQAGLEPFIVTQFGFAAAPILDFVAACRAAGGEAPVHVGLAGPASIATLAKFAVRCGIGSSLRHLAAGHAALARLLTETGPETVIHGLAGDGVGEAVAGLHFFTFGGVRRTARWLTAAAGGAIDLAAGDTGFRVPIASG